MEKESLALIFYWMSISLFGIAFIIASIDLIKRLKKTFKGRKKSN